MGADLRLLAVSFRQDGGGDRVTEGKAGVDPERLLEPLLGAYLERQQPIERDGVALGGFGVGCQI